MLTRSFVKNDQKHLRSYPVGVTASLNRGDARQSSTAPAASAPFASIAMCYITLPANKWQTGYIAGSRFVRSKRLEAISCTVGSNVLRYYQLSYQTAASGSDSDLLSTFMECRDRASVLAIIVNRFVPSVNLCFSSILI
jgi:hypothetical protein